MQLGGVASVCQAFESLPDVIMFGVQTQQGNNIVVMSQNGAISFDKAHDAAITSIEFVKVAG